jgi:hypothetical protein
MLALLAGAAWAADRPAIAEDIERRLGPAFMFTTDGGGTYRVYQRVESQEDLPEGAQTVCLLRDCFLEIATVPTARLEELGEAHKNLGQVRQRFRSVRETYDAMRRAPASERAEAARSWRAAIADVGRCLDHGDC